jgi:hypothetical protein
MFHGLTDMIFLAVQIFARVKENYLGELIGLLVGVFMESPASLRAKITAQQVVLSTQESQYADCSDPNHLEKWFTNGFN